MQKYEIIEQIGEGTYGVVLKCRNKENGDIVAVKRFKEPSNPNDAQYAKITSREIRTLKFARHPFVVEVIEAFRRKTKTFLVFEYCESTVLQLIEQHLLDMRAIKLITLQMLYAIRHLHDLNIMHRDIKPENLLLQFRKASDFGIGGIKVVPILKLCDFGFARSLSSGNALTQYVSTRWYRAPELLVGGEYSFPVDMWAFGLVLYEMTTGDPLMPGDTDIDMLYRIQMCVGELTADQRACFLSQPRNQGQKLHHQKVDLVAKRLAGHDMSLQRLVTSCLEMDPDQRITAEDALNSVFYDDVRGDVEKILRCLTGRESSADSIQQLCIEADEQIERSKSQLSVASKTPVLRSFSNARQCNVSGVYDQASARKKARKPCGSPTFGTPRGFPQNTWQAQFPYVRGAAFTQPRAENVMLSQALQARVLRTQGVNLPGLRKK